jgi:hypothetical protein
MVENWGHAQQSHAVSVREPIDEHAQPLDTMGVTPGHDRLAVRGEGQQRGPPVGRIRPTLDQSVAFQFRRRRGQRRLLDLLGGDQVSQPTRPIRDSVCSTDNAEKLNRVDAGSRMNTELKSSMAKPVDPLVARGEISYRSRTA